MLMDKKRKDRYLAGIAFLMFFIGFVCFAIWIFINFGLNLSDIILSGLGIVSGILGFGTFLKPNKFETITTGILKLLFESGKNTSDSHNKQIQEKSSGVQVMATQGGKVTITPRTEESDNQTSKRYSCPECGYPFIAYPPDDNHPLASVEEEYANEYALGTVIKRPYTCEKCGKQITLYWYKEKGFVGFVGGIRTL